MAIYGYIQASECAGHTQKSIITTGKAETDEAGFEEILKVYWKVKAVTDWHVCTFFYHWTRAGEVDFWIPCVFKIEKEKIVVLKLGAILEKMGVDQSQVASITGMFLEEINESW